MIFPTAVFPCTHLFLSQFHGLTIQSCFGFPPEELVQGSLLAQPRISLGPRAAWSVSAAAVCVPDL